MLNDDVHVDAVVEAGCRSARRTRVGGDENLGRTRRSFSAVGDVDFGTWTSRDGRMTARTAVDELCRIAEQRRVDPVPSSVQRPEPSVDS